MGKDEIKKKAEELAEDTEFVEKLKNAETAEEVADLLSSRDIEVSAEEVMEAANLLTRYESGELSDEDLENVSGGSIALLCCCIGSVVGMFTAMAIEDNLHAQGKRW